MTEAFDQKSALADATALCPLVAILRGVKPDEVIAIADAIIDAGFSMIEVPLNSPDPLASIALLAVRYPPNILIGAGTVLTTRDVAAVQATGARLIVSPNTAPAVIRAAVAAGMISLPGYFTPSEAFAALEAGAHGLKLFPAEGASLAYLKAQRAVVAMSVPIFAVGGVSVENIADWLAAGATGAGLGSALYKPAMTVADVGLRAAQFVAAVRQQQAQPVKER
jgi:2-dehydro-3-deoxyphosphogalactonate aldolase